MSNTKHTPGPWHLVEPRPQDIKVSSLADNPKDDAIICTVFSKRKDQDAKLIAAAPELLEALLEVSPLLDLLIERTPTGKNRNDLCDFNIKVKSAIKKATE